MQDGLEAGKMLYIISEQSEAIAQRVVDELERGVTVLKGKGFYSGEERPVLLCVVSRGEMCIRDRAWTGWASIWLGPAFFLASLGIFRVGVRHYRSTGS